MLTRVGVPVEYEADRSAPEPQPTTLICFSHLRWNFVFQRPQHLMSRFAREMNVIYWEEPVDIGEHETGLSAGARSAGLGQRPPRRSAPSFRNVGRGTRSCSEAASRCASWLAAWATDRLVLYTDDASFLARPRCDHDGLRRDGRAVEVQVRAGEAARARAGADRPCRHRFHRRIQPLRGEEGPPCQRSLLRIVGRPRAFLQGARAPVRPGGPGRPAEASPRLLRSDR